MNSIYAFYPAARLSNCVAEAMTPPSGNLRVTAGRRGYAVMLRVGGEIDSANVASWERLLERIGAATAEPGPLLIDIRETDFLGSDALRALVTQSLRCRRRGVRLCLISTRPIVARLISACRWEAEIPIFSSIDAAIDLAGAADPDPRRRLIEAPVPMA